MARILVVDDDDAVRSALTDLLRRKGYEVEKGSDGSMALEMLKDRPFDLVITDIVMPVKEGLETILEVRRGFPEIKIIAISGGGRIDPKCYLAMAEKLGAHYALMKPFENDELLIAINNLTAVCAK